MSARGRRRAHRGQAIIEVAMVLPVLIVLLAGASQVAAITFGKMTAQSAAVQGARIASETPQKSLDFSVTLGTTSYTCGQTPTDTQTESSVCDAVRSATGLASSAGFTTTVSISNAISSRVDHPARLVGNSCPSGASAIGTVSTLPAGTVATVSSPSKATSGTVTTSSSGTYSICLTTPPGGKSSQTTSITATVTDGSGCVYNGSTTVTISGKGAVSPTPADITLGAGTCPVQPTPVPSPTPNPSPVPTPTPGSSPTPPASPTCSVTIADTTWVTVTVSYPVTIFVPLVNTLLADSPGSSVRTVTATERMQVEPCNVTQGA